MATCEENDEAIDAALVDALTSPKRVEVDGQVVESRPVSDLLAVRKALRSDCVQRSGAFPVQLFQAKPPGAV